MKSKRTIGAVRQGDRLQLDTGMRADAADDRATWNMLFPLGRTKYRGDFTEGIAFDQFVLGKMLRNFKRDQESYLGTDAFGIPVTFTHVGPSIPDNHAPIENRRAAGWIEDLRLDANGLMALIRWTDEARFAIRADQFRFLSPEFALSMNDPDSGRDQGPTLFGAGLLNDPFLKEMPRVAASSTVVPPKAAPSAKPGEADMDKAKLCALLGMSPESSDDDVYMTLSDRLKLAAPAVRGGQTVGLAAEEKKALELAAETSKTELAAEKSKNTALSSQVTSLSAQVKEFATKFDEAEKARKEVELTDLARELVREGKITAAQQDMVKGFAATVGAQKVKEFYAASPKVVDLKTTGVDNPQGATTVGEDRKLFFAEVDKLVEEKKWSTAKATAHVREQMPEVAKRIFART